MLGESVKKSRLIIAGALALAMAGAGGLTTRAQAPPSSSKTIELPPDNPIGTLKAGSGVEVVRSNCASCHSTDYIVRQPGGNAKHWEPQDDRSVRRPNR
jgi:cytochrome c5